jgi:hypothetical protein
MARPIDLWGDPDSRTFAHDYLVIVRFMGRRLTWHKWAVAPLMAVEADIKASGVQYRWATSDMQTYCNRNIAGTHTKSNHSWALAMDINPRENPWQRPLKTDIPPAVREAFTRHGFKWGGTYSKPDTMHFEYLGLPVKEGDDMPIDTVSASTVKPALAKLVEAGIVSKPEAHKLTDAASVGLLWVVVARLLEKFS